MLHRGSIRIACTLLVPLLMFGCSSVEGARDPEPQTTTASTNYLSTSQPRVPSYLRDNPPRSTLRAQAVISELKARSRCGHTSYRLTTARPLQRGVLMLNHRTTTSWSSSTVIVNRRSIETHGDAVSARRAGTHLSVEAATPGCPRSSRLWVTLLAADSQSRSWLNSGWAVPIVDRTAKPQ